LITGRRQILQLEGKKFEGTRSTIPFSMSRDMTDNDDDDDDGGGGGGDCNDDDDDDDDDGNDEWMDGWMEGS